MEIRGGKLKLSEDRPSIDIMEEGVVVVGNIREATVVEEYIFDFSSPFRFVNTNQRRRIARGIRRIERGVDITDRHSDDIVCWIGRWLKRWFPECRRKEVMNKVREGRATR